MTACFDVMRREAMRASAVFGMAGTLERVLLMGARKCRSWEAVHCLEILVEGLEAGHCLGTLDFACSYPYSTWACSSAVAFPASMLLGCPFQAYLWAA